MCFTWLHPLIQIEKINMVILATKGTVTKTAAMPQLWICLVELWHHIFKLPFRCTRETKLQSFQYRLVHRIIPTRKKLYEWKIVNEPNCTFCNEIDDTRHFFLLCSKVQIFWDTFFKWWNRISKENISLRGRDVEENILFGFQVREEMFEALNYCVIVAKFYIYRQKLYHNNNVCFLDYLCELKYKLKVEHCINVKNNTMKLFNKFVFIYEQL